MQAGAQAPVQSPPSPYALDDPPEGATTAEGSDFEASSRAPYVLNAPSVVLRGIAFDAGIGGFRPEADVDAVFQVRIANGSPQQVVVSPDGTMRVPNERTESLGSTQVELLRNGQVVARAETNALPGWVSILPPVIAIAAALFFRQVIPALFFGILAGAWFARGLGLAAFGMGTLDTFQIYVLGALADADHAAIILFSLMIGGMVGVISRNGGMQGVVAHIIRWAQSPRAGQLSTGLLGVMVFFDDYTNTLVVGNTMRSVTDRLRISREKLAYIVDSTAAPVACLALVTTWIGYEVGLIGAALESISGFGESAYSVFLNSIPYSFYPVFAILFVFVIAGSRKDFGPMWRAEQRARQTGQVLAPDAAVDDAAGEDKDMVAKPGIARRSINAILPVVVLVVSALVGLVATGEGESFREIIGTADSYASLMWGSLLGALTAVALSLAQRLLSVAEAVSAWYAGVKSMLLAAIVLVMAWALSEITGVLHTADYLVSVLGESLNPGFVPALVFLIAAVTAFSTGASWGTMGILMPLVVPLVWAVLQINDMGDPRHYHILYSSVSCVLAGAVLGDHCSPISDTTILSSMASGCSHIDHVRTQLPYALSVGGVAILVGTLPAGFGIPWWSSMLVGVAVLVIGLRVIGRDVPDLNGEPMPERSSPAAP